MRHYFKRNNIRSTSLSKSQLIKKVKGLFTSPKNITLSKIPDVLQDDLLNFIEDHHLEESKKENIIISKNEYRSWLKKITLYDDGFDYDIKCNS